MSNHSGRGYDPVIVVGRIMSLVTVSIGAATALAAPENDPSQLVATADSALYRAKHMEERRLAKEAAGAGKVNAPQIHVTENGERRLLDMDQVAGLINAACQGLEKHVDAEAILAETVKNLYDGVPMTQVYDSAILAARTLIEKDPAYSQVTARILLHTIRKEILGAEVTQAEMSTKYAEYFPKFIARGIEAELLDEKLATYDLARSNRANCTSRAVARTPLIRSTVARSVGS